MQLIEASGMRAAAGPARRNGKAVAGPEG